MTETVMESGGDEMGNHGEGSQRKLLGRIITVCCVVAATSCGASPKHCAHRVDRLPEGPLGSAPPVVRTAVCRREPIGVYVIKNEHASLPPARRSSHLGWGVTAAGWLCDCLVVQLGTEG